MKMHYRKEGYTHTCTHTKEWRTQDIGSCVERHIKIEGSRESWGAFLFVGLIERTSITSGFLLRDIKIICATGKSLFIEYRNVIPSTSTPTYREWLTSSRVIGGMEILNYLDMWPGKKQETLCVFVCVCVCVCVCEVHLLMDTWVVSISWLL